MINRQTQPDDPLWYKDAIIYELHIKSFYDSNEDGIGDFEGLIQRLDYLQDLGATALWLLPFYPSPLLDDGYDIADYFNINPDYGTLADFKRLLREAHKRGIRIITELVINHTSDQHKWFQRGRRAKPGSVYRDFYVWSDTTEKYKEARIIFTDFESSNWAWDPVAQAYYWHRFYSHQPDLNYDNPRVRKEILRVLEFWFNMGVDGMRLDAVPYLFERDDTNCENLPETHEFLKTLRAHVEQKFPGRMLLAEANQWPEDAAAYFGDGPVYVLLLEVNYTNAPREEYVVPVGFASRDRQVQIMKDTPDLVIGQAQLKGEEGVLYEAFAGEEFREALLEMIARRRSRKVSQGRVTARRGSRFADVLGDKTLPLASRVLKAEQSNTSIIYDNTFFLKLYRRIEEGINPDVELSRELTERTSFGSTPAFAGSIEWQRDKARSMTLASLLELAPNETDAWSYTLDNVERSFGHALAIRDHLEALPELPASALNVEPDAVPEVVRDFIGSVYFDMAALLGQRTAELHVALASLSHGTDVTPEPFTLLYQKSLHQSIRQMMLKIFRELEQNLSVLDDEVAEAVKRMLGARKTLLNRLRRLVEKKIPVLKIRTHGDYHLGQVLFTGKDFVIIDFEGEPARSITERRLKQPALRDVAGMIRSFHYAAHGTILLRMGSREGDSDYLEHWADVWYYYVSGAFMNAYLKTVGESQVVPQGKRDFALLLETFLLEKAAYELGYELNNRPDWLSIPVRGIEHVIKGGL